jgi:hypothetical protein
MFYEHGNLYDWTALAVVERTLTMDILDFWMDGDGVWRH